MQALQPASRTPRTLQSDSTTSTFHHLHSPNLSPKNFLWYFEDTHTDTYQKRTSIGCKQRSPTGQLVHHCRQTLLIRLGRRKTPLTIIKHSMSATETFCRTKMKLHAKLNDGCAGRNTIKGSRQRIILRDAVNWKVWKKYGKVGVWVPNALSPWLLQWLTKNSQKSTPYFSVNHLCKCQGWIGGIQSLWLSLKFCKMFQLTAEFYIHCVQAAWWGMIIQSVRGEEVAKKKSA